MLDYFFSVKTREEILDHLNHQVQISRVSANIQILRIRQMERKLVHQQLRATIVMRNFQPVLVVREGRGISRDQIHHHFHQVKVTTALQTPITFQVSSTIHAQVLAVMFANVQQVVLDNVAAGKKASCVPKFVAAREDARRIHRLEVVRLTLDIIL